MSLVQEIKLKVAAALETLYSQPFVADDITVNQTNAEFEGDYTIVLFSLLKRTRTSPDQLGKALGEHLANNHPELISSYQLVKGFLNLSISSPYFLDFLNQNFGSENFGRKPESGRTVIVEYSSPNTNKPIHLGHLRNNFLGWSISEILKANGNRVVKTSIINDRGIHICKSMIAWQLFADGATPESTGIKGDHFVGDYYVRCEHQIREEAKALSEKVGDGDFESIRERDKQKLVEIQELMGAIIGDSDKDKEKLEKLAGDRTELIRANTDIMKKAQQMLVDWENGKPEVIELWKKMNGWVYEGFDATYKRIGTDFDKVYYESDTYLLGKRFVEEGLANGVLYKKEDGSVWIDLKEEGLDEKLLLRKDGTSVYMTQDLGLAEEKFSDFNYDQSIYVIADEQNYHMKVLQACLKRLGKPYASGIYHLSYGMVELPSGRMKSREGTVVDADDLVNEMVNISAKHTEELGKVKDFTEEDLEKLYETLGLGALKFYLMRVDPKKRMIFNPEESIDFHGFTGPFVQYTYARIKSIFRKENAAIQSADLKNIQPSKLEKDLLVLLEQFPATIEQAALEYNPSVLAIYVFNLAKQFNSFYTAHSVLNAETEELKQFRLMLASFTANVIKSGMGMLGVGVPERM